MGRRVITSGDVMAAPPVSDKATKAPPDTATTKPDDYATRLLKYIPAEIVAAFLVISAMLNEAEDLAEVVPWIVFGVLLVMTPLYLWRVTREKEKPLAMSHLVVGTIAFAIWVFALGGPFADLSWYQTIYGSVLLIVYTLSIPIFIGK